MLPEWIYSERLTYRKEIKRICGLKLSFPRVKKTLAFVETQGIGDYILIHNFFKYVKQSKKYKDYNIILIAKNNISSLVEAYDSMYIDEILYVDSRNAERVLKGLAVEELVCIYGGTGKFEKWVLKNVKAKRKIVHGNACKYADINLLTPDLEMFHRDRMRMVFEQLIEEKIPADVGPYFKNELDSGLSDKCIFISPFANDSMRTWGFENYVSLIKLLADEYQNDIVILGDSAQRDAINSIISACSDLKVRVFNAGGKFSINGLMDIFRSRALLLIGNETGTIHIAAAANTHTLCISNGSYYGIYHPYDKINIKYIYPEGFDYKYTCVSKLDINSIQVDEVFKYVKSMLNNQTFV